jgi:hypothetical protein
MELEYSEYQMGIHWNGGRYRRYGRGLFLPLLYLHMKAELRAPMDGRPLWLVFRVVLGGCRKRGLHMSAVIHLPSKAKHANQFEAESLSEADPPNEETPSQRGTVLRG